jgi:hypothetical protein
MECRAATLRSGSSAVCSAAWLCSGVGNIVWALAETLLDDSAVASMCSGSSAVCGLYRFWKQCCVCECVGFGRVAVCELLQGCFPATLFLRCSGSTMSCLVGVCMAGKVT